ncbi:hypothetical protein [Lentibacillus sp.]|nr:hypothetical protein [Lentibacillus sp.]HLS07695.1 hypothetical protein [Lentibacillus sp.]
MFEGLIATLHGRQLNVYHIQSFMMVCVIHPTTAYAMVRKAPLTAA